MLDRGVRAGMSDASNVSKRMLSIGLAAIMVLSSIVVVLPVQAQQQASMSVSTDKFVGTNLVQVVIKEPAKPTTISVSVSVSGSVSGSKTVTVPQITSGSDTYEFYITTHNTAVPKSPLNSTPNMVRIGGDIPVTLGENDKVTITYGSSTGNLTKTITYAPTTATLTADRSEAGNGNKIRLIMTDSDFNFDPTTVDEIEITSSLTNIEQPTSTNIGYDTTDPKSRWVETGTNTGVFELLVSKVTDASPPAPSDKAITIGNQSFPSTLTVQIKDYNQCNPSLDANNQIKFCTLPDPTNNLRSVTIQLRQTDGTIDFAAPVTLGNGVQMKITDADQNVDTRQKDTINGSNIKIANTQGSSNLLIETDDNTGIFVPNLSNNRIPIMIVSSGTTPEFDATNNVLKVKVTDIANDKDITIEYNPGPPPEATRTFKIQHFAGDITTTTPSVPVTGKAVIEIVDMDLNRDATIVDGYTLTFNSNQSTPVAISDGLANLIIKARGDLVNFSSSPLTIQLTEVDTNGNLAPNTGRFRGEVDISKINAALANLLTDGDRITFEYKDNTESPTVTRTVEVRIGKPSGIIELDRTSYPPSTLLPDGTERPTKIHVIITDPSFNESSTSQNTLDIKNGINGKGTLKMNLIRGSTTLTFTPNTGLGFPETATEDGINTGRFTVDITLPRNVKVDTNKNVTAVNDASPDHVIGDGWQLRLIYKDSNGDEQTATASIVSNTAVITTDKTTYDLGSTIILQIREPDWNNDSDKVDEIPLNALKNGNTKLLVVNSDKLTDEPLDNLTNKGVTFDPSNLRETEKNSGIFEIKIKNINQQVVSRGKNLEFTYTDRTPSGGGDAQEVKLAVLIVSIQPDIILDKEVYTPFDRMCIKIVDPGANTDSDRKDTLDVGDARLKIVVGGVSMKVPNTDETNVRALFEETEANSGVFQFKDSPNCVSIRDDVNANAKPGDGIRVEYRTADKQVELSKTARIAFHDGSVTLDKDAYKIGETARITIEDPDENRKPDAPDQFTIKVVSDTDPAGISVNVRETGDRTGKFTADIILTSEVSSGTRLQVREGDQITVIYTDETLPDQQTIKMQLVNRDEEGLRTLSTRNVAATATIGVTLPPTERFAVQQPRTVDQAGNPTTPSVNVLVSIATQIKNNTNKAMDYVYIVQVKDANGIVVSISTVSSTLDGGRTANVSASWLPTAPGTYTIETFVWSELGKPSPLSPLQKITVTVT